MSPPEPDPGEVEGLAAVICRHELLSGFTATRHKRKFAGSFVCLCGHFEHEVMNVGYQTLHANHLAAVLASDWLTAHVAKGRERMAQAMSEEIADRVTWDEGTEYIAVEAAQRIARGVS